MSLEKKLVTEKLKETNSVPLELKLKTYDILEGIRKGAEKPCGMILVLGYTPKWEDYTYKMDYDKFEEEKCNINDSCAKERVYETYCYDGAILISPTGEVTHSGIGLSPKINDMLKELNLSRNMYINEIIGIDEKVGTRHSSSFAASYKMKDTLIYVLSEETGRISVFYQGKLVVEDKYERPNSLQTIE